MAWWLKSDVLCRLFSSGSSGSDLTGFLLSPGASVGYDWFYLSWPLLEGAAPCRLGTPRTAAVSGVALTWETLSKSHPFSAVTHRLGVLAVILMSPVIDQCVVRSVYPSERKQFYSRTITSKRIHPNFPDLCYLHKQLWWTPNRLSSVPFGKPRWADQRPLTALDLKRLNLVTRDWSHTL